MTPTRGQLREVFRLETPTISAGRAPVDGDGGGGDDGGMEDRLKALEHTVAIIEAKLPDLATNDGVDARLSKTETKIIVWVVGAVIATGLVGKFLFPAPVPVAAPVQPTAPIIIQVPVAPTAPAAPATTPAPKKP